MGVGAGDDMFIIWASAATEAAPVAHVAINFSTGIGPEHMPVDRVLIGNMRRWLVTITTCLLPRRPTIFVEVLSSDIGAATRKNPVTMGNRSWPLRLARGRGHRLRNCSPGTERSGIAPGAIMPAETCCTPGSAWMRRMASAVEASPPDRRLAEGIHWTLMASTCVSASLDCLQRQQSWSARWPPPEQEHQAAIWL